VATGSGSSPSRWSVSVSSSGERWAAVPTAPEIFPKAIPAKARASRSCWRPSSAYHESIFRPKEVGSACTPWVRPTQTVPRCSNASARARAPSARRVSKIGGRARSRVSACAVSTRSLEVMPQCSQAFSSPRLSPTAVRKARTSWCSVLSSSSIRATVNRAFRRAASAVPAGAIPAPSSVSRCASSTSSQIPKRDSSSKRRPSAGRV